MALPSPSFVVNQMQAPQKVTHGSKQFQQQRRNNNTSYQKDHETTRGKKWNAWCAYCKIGFDTNEEFFIHRKNHEKCSFESCKFNASSEVVASHFQKCHSKSDSFHMVQNLTTPEEIEKWRSERRKRYPTVENMKIRAQSQEVRMQRGEKLVDKKSRFGDMKSQQRNNKQKNRPPKNRNRKQNQKIQQVPEKVLIESVVESSDDEPMRKIPKFTGTLKLADYHSLETTIKETSALSILGMYGGSDIESSACESQDEETLKPKIQEEPVENQSSEIEEEAPEEIPINRVSEFPDNPTKVEKSKFADSNKKRNRDQQPIPGTSNVSLKPSLLKYSKIKRAAPNEFLEKLLKDDIRHERNILLQCVNFVVKNNFFDPKVLEATPKADGN